MTDNPVGRPPLYEQPMKQTAIYLSPNQLEWLKAQSGSMSEMVRRMIDEAIQEDCRAPGSSVYLYGEESEE